MKKARVSTMFGQITSDYSVHAVPRNFKRRILCDPGVKAVDYQETDEKVNCSFCLEMAREIKLLA